jgi:hypothetical protein
MTGPDQADRRVRGRADGPGEIVGLRMDPAGCHLFPADQ